LVLVLPKIRIRSKCPRPNDEVQIQLDDDLVIQPVKVGENNGT